MTGLAPPNININFVQYLDWSLLLVLLLYMQSVWTHDFRDLIEKMKKNKTGGTAGRIADRVIQTKLEQMSTLATELEEMAAKAEQESHNKSTVAAERKLQEALEQCDQNRM